MAPFVAQVECRAVPQESGVREGEGVEESSVILDPERRLHLGEVLRLAALPEVPIKRLCRPDCRGICPVCGADRNLESCECSPAARDARWDALRGLSFPSDAKE
jgi:uncharacterized protein